MNNILQIPTRIMLPAGILLLLLIQGCINTSTTPASRFYLLNVSDDDLAATSGSPSPSDGYIGIGPVTLPDYLDRPHIVTRSDNTELYLAELHRWAEPLQENFSRVLAEHIADLTGTEKIIIIPSRNRAQLDLQIMVDVIQFDSSRNGDAVLIAYWSVENRDGSKLVDNKKSTIRLRVARPADYSEIVDTMSQAVAQLAREISAEIIP